MITYPTADVRALRVHAHTYAAYRRSDGGEEARVGVCRDAGPLPRCFVI